MGWTPPMTAGVGDPFTSAEFNAQVRDNLNYLKAKSDVVRGHVTAAGGIASGSVAYSVTRTGVGRYTITFGTAFSAAPVVVATPMASVGDEILTLNAPTATGVQVNINDPSNAPVDRDFCFVAMDA